ncbi:MAG: PAS domain S-box protein, partial [Caldithrix sp.]|nr:PAS domain S-box protein [Caldithrix sp.]
MGRGIMSKSMNVVLFKYTNAAKKRLMQSIEQNDPRLGITDIREVDALSQHISSKETDVLIASTSRLNERDLHKLKEMKQLHPSLFIVLFFKDQKSLNQRVYEINDSLMHEDHISALPSVLNHFNHHKRPDTTNRALFRTDIENSGAVQDSSNWKDSKTVRQKSEQKFRNIFENSNDAIFIHETDGKFVEVNNEACRRLGYSRAELLNLKPFHIDSEKHAQITSQRIEHIKTKRQLVFETAHRTKKGQIIPVEVSSRLIDFEDRQCILSITRDITERKEAEFEIQKLSRALEQSPVSVIITDAAGNIEYVNPKYFEIKHHTCHEVIGHKPHIFQAEYHKKESYEHMM